MNWLSETPCSFASSSASRFSASGRFSAYRVITTSFVILYMIHYKNKLIFADAIILIMEVGDMRLYKERWKAIEEIERQELRAMTPEQHWQKLNAIVRFAIETGMAME